MLRVSTSESMIPRPCFRISYTTKIPISHVNCTPASYFLVPVPREVTVCLLFHCMFTRCHILFRLLLPPIYIHTTCISLSLRRTSAPIHLTSVFGVLGTQETSCFVITGLLERDIFDLFLPEFDKPWVIHLRETCCCSTNLCTWRPNTVYKNRSTRRHQSHMSASMNNKHFLSWSYFVPLISGYLPFFFRSPVAF